MPASKFCCTVNSPNQGISMPVMTTAIAPLKPIATPMGTPASIRKTKPRIKMVPIIRAPPHATENVERVNS